MYNTLTPQNHNVIIFTWVLGTGWLFTPGGAGNLPVLRRHGTGSRFFDKRYVERPWQAANKHVAHGVVCRVLCS